MYRIKFHRPRKSLESVVGGAALVLALTLLPLGFSTPVKRTVDVANAYRQSGTFSYSARVVRPDRAYPTGVASTGQPLFLSSFDAMDVAFSYHLRSHLPHAVRGTVSMVAGISSESGWHESFTVAPPIAFSGDNANVRGTFDLRKLRNLMTQLSIDAGAVGSTYSIALQPVVRVTGSMGGKRLADTFSPVMPMAATMALLKLALAAPTAPPGATYAPPSASATMVAGLNPSKSGSARGVAPRQFALAQFQFSVSAVRGFALACAGIALLTLLSRLLKREREIWSMEKRLANRYGCVVVNVESIDEIAANGPTPFRVPDFESLASLARYSERPVLRETGDAGDGRAYAVEDAGRLYVYEPAPATVTASALSAAEGSPRDVAPDRPVRRTRGWRRRGVTLPAVGVLVAFVIGATLTIGMTAANTVPLTRASKTSVARQLAQFAPSECASLSLTSVITGSGTIRATAAHQLVLGSAGANILSDSNHFGNVCFVGGGGTDIFAGWKFHNDMCIVSKATQNNGTITDCNVVAVRP